MNNQTRTNQGGSVASFLIVAAILTAVTLGGIYLVQNRQQSPIVPVPSVSPSSSQAANPSESPSRSPITSPTPSAAPTSPVPSTPPSTGAAPSGNLPSTGPTEDALMMSIPAALLVAAVLGYIRSRKLRYGAFYR